VQRCDKTMSNTCRPRIAGGLMTTPTFERSCCTVSSRSVRGSRGRRQLERTGPLRAEGDGVAVLPNCSRLSLALSRGNRADAQTAAPMAIRRALLDGGSSLVAAPDRTRSTGGPKCVRQLKPVQWQ
jgi:hypothetical protein